MGGVMHMLEKIHSKSFRSGFLDGFAAPMLLFIPNRYPRASRIDASVDAAWRSVGDALKKSLESQGEIIGKTADKEGRNRRGKR